MALRYNIPKYSDRIGQDVQVKFGGLDRRLAACDGAICDMTNMCGDEFPLVTVRKGRREYDALYGKEGKCLGLHASDGTLMCVFEEQFMTSRNGATWTKKGDIESGYTFFADLGAYTVMFPQKKYYRQDKDEFGSLECTWTGTASFADGKYAGQDAKGCRIVTTGTAFSFNVGDAVTIFGAKDSANNQTIIIREISDDKKSLGFYENSFTVATGQTLTIKRTVPDMDFICENENRLWGCKGSTIYASKLGDPFNWNVFDGLASDSYAVDVGSDGDFTACCSYLGYPIFFKEDHIYKVYGSKPSNYQVMPSATLGVQQGSGKSLAVAGEILYYLSRVGVMAYSGGVPQCISENLGDVSYSSGVGGSDGMRYYLSTRNGTKLIYELLCYDTAAKQWYREDGVTAAEFAYVGDGSVMIRGLNAMLDTGDMMVMRSEKSNESRYSSSVEFADFVEGSPNKKSTAKLLVRAELEDKSELTVKMSFDGGAYETVQTLVSGGKRSYYLPILVKRCDRFRVKFEGKGMWRLYSLTREYSEGSAN